MSLRDYTPLTFGKYKGTCPQDVAEIDPQYIVWMYETVTNKPTCSEELYNLAQEDVMEAALDHEFEATMPLNFGHPFYY